MTATEAPRQRIEFRSIDGLVPYARNSRTHSDDQVAKLAAAMIEFGWTNPVLADDRGIVAGHGRVMAARVLYSSGRSLSFPNGDPIPAGMVPVVDCTGWSEAKRKAYVIWDNRSAELAGWDPEMLQLEIKDLADMGYDLELTGFTPDDLAKMFGVQEVPPSERDPEEVPALLETPHSVLGDVWVLGPHRVRCGDSTQFGDWEALMGGELADVMFTDPPYNVGYESKLAGSIKNDDMGDDQFFAFLLDFYRSAYSVMKEGASLYVFHADTEGLNFRRAFKEAGFKLSGCLVWRKDSLVLGRSDFQWQHEPCLYGWKPGSSHKWYGGRKQTTIQEYGQHGPIRQTPDGRWVIEVGDSVLVVDGEAKLQEGPSSVVFHEKPKRSAEHPTMKPVGLVEKFLRFSARPGDIVIDGFGGSGSTLIAADRLGMSARLQEFDPKFVDVIVRRWQNFTGRRAVHAETGEQFPVAPEFGKAEPK